jgi:hypothetical protein
MSITALTFVWLVFSIAYDHLETSLTAQVMYRGTGMIP